MKQKITCVIIDDDADAIKHLEGYVEQLPQLELVWTETSSQRALKKLHEETVDLVFVDVTMPKPDGFTLVHALHPKPHVIMVTAHEQFGASAFDVDVVDYLIKTVSFERFAKAVNKVSDKMGLITEKITVRMERDFFFVKVVEKEGNGRFTKVSFPSIHYVEVTNNISKIVLSGQQKISTRKPLTELAEALPSLSFLRVHRSYIVALDKISSVSGQKIRLNEIGATIPIGDNFKKEFDRMWSELCDAD